MAPLVSTRPARETDVGDIARFVRLLAQYEHLEHRFSATEADFRDALFGPRPRAFADIAELDGRPIGLAIGFYNFSTFAGRAGIYVEDLFVIPEARGLGAGKALLEPGQAVQRAR